MLKCELEPGSWRIGSSLPDIDLFQDLNEEQRRAVEAGDGPILVLAGPGSGKTRVLTHRVAHLIKGLGVSPHRVMAVTFTNKAAREMKERLLQLLGPNLREVTIGTFHAVCARILRRELQHIGRDNHFVIYDATDQLTIIGQALQDWELDDKIYRPLSVQGAISRAKSELLDPSEYRRRVSTYWEEVAGRVYERYQELLLANNALDFDDLLMVTVELFREKPEILEKYQGRYLHILVDEFQDTNVAQYVIVKELAAKHRNIFVVGDPDQSIYSWRNADIRNILHFERDYPDCETFFLARNYRSTQTVLDVAESVISSANYRGKARSLWTDKGQGPPVRAFEAYDGQEEAEFVVDEIERLVARGDCRPGECAIMYRTNAQSRLFEDAFMRRGLPYRLVGATRFYERKEIKDVLAYLRVIYNPNDDMSLSRIINVPPRGIGQKTLAQLIGRAQKENVSLYRALRKIRAESELSSRGRDTLLRFLILVEELIDAQRELDLLGLLDRVLESSGYASFLRDGTERGEERWRNVMELRTVAQEYLDLPRQGALTTFLEEVALVSDVDNLDERVDAPTLLTLHSAKGLEFATVFIVGMEEGLFPHSRSFDDPAQMEEERRLCYVGITRAKEYLYLVYAFRRALYGNSSINEPSRFLIDVPMHLVEGRQRVGEEAAKEKLEVKELASDCQFRAGDKVHHPKFGEGIVVSSELSGEDEVVVVAFVGVKLKKLLASYAKMEKL